MNKRQQSILKLLSEKNKISVNELTAALGVSGVTVRQDLGLLEEQGFLRRVHGGAEFRSGDDISQRLAINYEVKSAIAERAAREIAAGETIFIEAGSTNALLARRLTGYSRLTVVTNNVFITRVLKDSRVEVILLGGLFQHQSECVVGPVARAGLKGLRFSKAFLGVDGISLIGEVTGNDIARAEISAEVVRRSQRTCVLTDAGKFGREALSRICALEDLATVITDPGIPPDIREGISKAGPELIIVSPKASPE